VNAPLRIRGGLALPRHKPGLDRPILDLPLPPVLLHPLLGHGGRELTPCVVAGQRVHAGTPLADGLRACASGTVRAIERHPILDPYRRHAPCVVIDTQAHESSATAVTSPIMGPATGVIGPIDDADAMRALLSAGIDGQGGAGFPAAVKLRAVGAVGCRLLLINACECEPGIACDEALLQEASSDVVAAIGRLVRVLAAQRTCIAVEHDKRAAIAALKGALCASTGIETLLFEPVYPSGAEGPLLDRVMNHLGLPALPGGCRPSDAGVLCLNLATALALGRALQGEPPATRIVTVTGQDARLDANVRATLGTPVGWLLERLGHTLADAARVRIGGPLSGHESGALGASITATTHAIHLCAAAPAPDPVPTRPCIRCGECAPVCPVALQPQLLHWHADASDLPALRRLGIDRCIECGCCDVVCPSALPLTAGFRAARRELAERARRTAEAERAGVLVQRRSARLQREEQRREQAPPVAARSNVETALARVKARAATRAQTGVGTGATTGDGHRSGESE